MTEVLVSMAVLAILGLILLPTFQSALETNTRSGENLALSGSVLQARNIAAREGNGYRYPTTLVTDLAALDDRYVTGAATGEQVSVHRSSDTLALFATWAQPGVCVVVVDRVDTEEQSWAVDADTGTCSAALAALVGTITGTAFEPTIVDL